MKEKNSKQKSQTAEALEYSDMATENFKTLVAWFLGGSKYKESIYKEVKIVLNPYLRGWFLN